MNRRTALALSTVALLCLGAASIARADETLKFRVVAHATSVQSQDIGDVEGHTASLVRFSGLASFPDGTTGTAYFVGTTDYIKGAGTAITYTNLTFGDGSVLWTKAVSTTKVEGAKSLFQGTLTVLGGKGRYEGAKGDGSVTGARIVPLATGADLYNDLVINVKK
jgi:hypothetical protein